MSPVLHGGAEAVLGIVQARMSSTRFPGKMLHPLGGRPAISYLLERLTQSPDVGRWVVATSTDQSDDPLAAFCQDQGVDVFRGPLDDVAGRFAAVLEQYPCEVFARVCADSLFFDTALLGLGLSLLRVEGSGLATNVLVRTFPPGQSVEVIRRDVFLNALPHMTTPAHREHVTAYFYEHPKDFTISEFYHDPNLSDVSLALDTPQDAAFFQQVLDALDRPAWTYGLEELMRVVHKVRRDAP